jgi:Putative peptidoglycan binding domain
MRKVLLLVVVLLAVSAAWWTTRPLSTTETSSTEPTVEELATTRIVRTDLVETETLTGTLRFAEPTTLVAQLPGTVTWLRAEGDVVDRGDVVMEVDGAPVILFVGDRPMWRLLRQGVADGNDIEELETNLAALGFDDDGSMTVDQEFTSATRRAVRDWQESVGLDDTGVVEPGRVLYVEQAIRIGKTALLVGGPVVPGTPAFTVSSPSQEIVVWNDADKPELLEIATTVQVTLPDDRIVAARVTRVASTVTVLGDQRVRETILLLVNRNAATDFDETPVEIEVETERIDAVLAVPVNSLLALSEGGYAVEVVRSGEVVLVGIDTGTFADGLAEITGDIAEGDLVVIPE